jgi:hypothetical protein
MDMTRCLHPKIIFVMQMCQGRRSAFFLAMGFLSASSNGRGSGLKRSWLYRPQEASKAQMQTLVLQTLPGSELGMHSWAPNFYQLCSVFHHHNLLPRQDHQSAMIYPRFCNRTLFLLPDQAKFLHNGRQEHIAGGVHFPTFFALIKQAFTANACSLSLPSSF